MLGSSPAGIMLAVAQMEEQWIVAPQVAGSSPVSHPSRVGSIWLNWYSTGLEIQHSERISEFESQARRFKGRYTVTGSGPDCKSGVY